MRIDSQRYVAPCSCGREHRMTTKLCIIEPGCLAHLNDYLTQYGLTGYTVALYDENTYLATEGLHPKADREIILDPAGLHADNHGVALAMSQLPEECAVLIAVGSGTVHDITRYCAHEKGIPFVSCPTAASVDGFCSSVAAMTWDGFKKTFTAVAPTLVIADLNIISQAPLYLSKSGFGDMIGKYIALADWRIAHALTGEYFCPFIYDITRKASSAVLESAPLIQSRDHSAYEKLTYGLLMSGLAMQLLGNSRCASGAEHHISHFIEMRPNGLFGDCDALHGEKVGVGTLLVCREYHRLRCNRPQLTRDYCVTDPDTIASVFGDALSGSIIAENRHNCAKGITANDLESHWDEICEIINTIPTYEELIGKYEAIGAKAQLTDLGIPEADLSLLMTRSPLVRNRLTLMRLRQMLDPSES